MDNTSSRAGLMSGIAMAIYGSVPSDVQDDGDLTRSPTRHRAMRHEQYRETLRRMMSREAGYGRRATRQQLDD